MSSTHDEPNRPERDRSLREAALVCCVASCAAVGGCATGPQLPFEAVEYGYAHERTIRADSARVDLRVAEVGVRTSSATPIVFLHPWGGSMLIYADVAEPIARGRRGLLLDLPGHGKSSKPPGRYPPRRHALAVRDLLDAEGIEQAVLLGNSMGGATALEFARLFPERVERLVLIGAPGAGGVPGPMVDLALAWATPRNIRSLDGAIAGLFWRIVGGSSSPLARRTIGAYVGGRDAPDWSLYAAAVHSALVEVIDYRPPLETIDTPAQVVVGSRDLVVWPWLGRALADRLPNADLVMLEGCGHLPQLDCASQLIEVVRRFIER